MGWVGWGGDNTKRVRDSVTGSSLAVDATPLDLLWQLKRFRELSFGALVPVMQVWDKAPWEKRKKNWRALTKNVAKTVVKQRRM